MGALALLAADARVVWVKDLVTVVREEGRVTKLRGIMVDITAFKQVCDLPVVYLAELLEYTGMKSRTHA